MGKWESCFGFPLSHRAPGFFFRAQPSHAPLCDSGQQFPFGLLHPDGSFGVGLGLRKAFQVVHVHAGPQVTLAFGRLAEDFQRRGPAPIPPPTLAVGCDDDLWDSAGTVEVQITVQILAMKLVDRSGILDASLRPPR